jgi:transcriptional regulator with GAF, ATPase, and Fis domain
VDARVISATNADLNAEVGGGKFREDLLFRIHTIHLPPLVFPLGCCGAVVREGPL